MAPTDVIDELNDGTLTSSPTAQRYLVRSMRMQALIASARVWAVLGLGGFLWTWSALHANWIQYAITAGYTVSVVLPVLWLERRG